MKISKKLAAFILSACMVCAVPTVIAGCVNPDGDGTHSGETDNKDPIKKKDGTDLIIKAGESETITVSEYITANGNAVSVDSSRKEVATVTLSDGTVTISAVSAGTSNVKIVCGSVEVIFAVKVEANDGENQSVVFGDIAASLNLSKTQSVEVPLAPKSGGEGISFTYELSAPVIGAEIDAAKKVLTYTATETGKAEISVIAKNDGAEYTFKVIITVTDGSETVYYTVSVDGVETRVEDGGEFVLPEYTGTPEAGKEFAGWLVNGETYSAGDKITVDGDVTVISAFVNKKYTVSVEGVESVLEHGAQIVLSADKYTGEIPDGKMLAGWLVGDERVSVGSTVTIVEPVVIVAIIEDEPEEEPVKIKEGEDKTLNLADGTLNINVADYITVNGNAVSVSSSEESVAGVSESQGTVTVTAHSAGKTVVTLSCKEISIEFNVTVKNAVPVFEDLTVNIDKGLSLSGTADIKCAGAATFTYEYSAEGVKVEDGKLTYTAAGNVSTGEYEITVSVTATDGANGETETTSFKLKVKVTDYYIVNGGFETGDLTGWIYTVADGSTDFGRVEGADYYWNNPEKSFNKSGNYLFTGIETVAGTNQESGRGTLRSSEFTLKQNGWISFMLGGAHNALCGIRVRNAADGSILAEFNNLDKGFDGTLDKYKFKFTGMQSDIKCYIEIFDDAEGGWGLVVADDICTYYTEEPENAVAIIPAQYNVNIGTGIINGGFEDGLYGWRLVTTLDNGGAFGFVSENAGATWGDDSVQNSYNNDGKFFQNGAEGSKGYLLSSVFEVSAAGWMSFKLGGNKANCYVAVVDAETGEELVKYVNEKFVGGWPNNGWEMYGYKVNLVADGIAAGRKVQIKITDEATSDYGVVVADSFKTDYAAEPDGPEFTKATNQKII
ncbi:MAG: hypothetical protein K2L42_02150 [Clostridia bacterium]|nr:hypothetical protein [Clostridia bacterium]